MELRIKELRILKGLTQGELAKRVGISRAYMTQLEGGTRRANNDILEGVAKALGVSPSELIIDNAQTEAITTLLSIAKGMSEGDQNKVLEYAQLLKTASNTP